MRQPTFKVELTPDAQNTEVLKGFRAFQQHLTGKPGGGARQENFEMATSLAALAREVNADSPELGPRTGAGPEAVPSTAMRTSMMTTLPGQRERCAIEIEEEPMADETAAGERASRYGPGHGAAHVSVVDIEQGEGDDIEEDIDGDGLLSPTADNALTWQQVARDQKPASYCTRSGH